MAIPLRILLPLSAMLLCLAAFTPQVSAAATPPHVKAERPRKTVLRRLPIVESTLESPAARGVALTEYLAERLGKRWHARADWAGRRGLFTPVLEPDRVWKPIGEVKNLTVHHADGVPDEHPAAMIRLIHSGHTGAGGRLQAADVGYHFFVDRKGGVWEGRSAARLGTHVGSTPEGLNNTGNLGLCGLGSFAHETPPRAMAEAMAELADLLAEYYGRPLAVRGHRDWIGVNHFFPRGGTDCPGQLAGAIDAARRRIAVRFGDPGTEREGERRVAAAGKSGGDGSAH